MGLARLRSQCRQGHIPNWRLQGKICSFAFSYFLPSRGSLHTLLGSWPFFHLQSQHCHLSLTLARNGSLPLRTQWLDQVHLGDLGYSPHLKDLNLNHIYKVPLAM